MVAALENELADAAKAKARIRALAIDETRRRVGAEEKLREVLDAIPATAGELGVDVDELTRLLTKPPAVELLAAHPGGN